MATASTVQTGQHEVSSLPGFMISKSFAVKMFLGVVWFMALPFVYHAFTNGLDFVVDGQSEHAVFQQAGAAGAFFLLAAHMVFGAAMNFLAPYQVYLGYTRTKKQWHRVIGFSSIAIAFFGASVGSLYWSMYYDENLSGPGFTGEGYNALVYQAGSMYGIVMFYVIFKVVQSLVNRDFARHKEWAIRLFMLAIGSYLFRCIQGYWMIGYAMNDGQPFMSENTMDFIESWGFYVIPLAVYELYLQLRKAGFYKKLPAYAPFVTSLAGITIISVGSISYVMTMLMRY